MARESERRLGDPQSRHVSLAMLYAAPRRAGRLPCFTLPPSFSRVFARFTQSLPFELVPIRSFSVGRVLSAVSLFLQRSWRWRSRSISLSVAAASGLLVPLLALVRSILWERVR